MLTKPVDMQHHQSSMTYLRTVFLLSDARKAMEMLPVQTIRGCPLYAYCNSPWQADIHKKKVMFISETTYRPYQRKEPDHCIKNYKEIHFLLG